MPPQHNKCPRSSICRHFLSKWQVKQKITSARPKTIGVLPWRTLINSVLVAVMFLPRECLESGSRAESLKISREWRRATHRHMKSWSQCIAKYSWARNIDLVWCLVYKLLNSYPFPLIMFSWPRSQSLPTQTGLVGCLIRRTVRPPGWLCWFRIAFAIRTSWEGSPYCHSKLQLRPLLSHSQKPLMILLKCHFSTSYCCYTLRLGFRWVSALSSCVLQVDGGLNCSDAKNRPEFTADN